MSRLGEQARYLFGDFMLDVGAHSLCHSNEPIPLTIKEFDTLLVLIEAAPSAVAKDDLAAKVWPDSFVGDSSLARNVSVLRKHLGAESIQTVPKYGYRFALTVAPAPLDEPELASGSQGVVAAVQDNGHPRVAGIVTSIPGQSRRRTVAVVAVAAMLGLILTAAAAWWILRSRREGTATNLVRDDPARRVLAVLPFENISKDRSRDYFSNGLAEEINGKLSKIASLQVLSRAAVAKYKDPRADLRQLATELGIGSAVIGSVRQEGSRVRIRVEVVDPRNSRTIWSEQYDRELLDIFEVQSDVALHIADALKVKLSPNEQERLERRPTENLAAYDLYLRSQGFSMADRQRNLEAVRMLDQALRIDPKFAVAQAWMAYRTVFQAYWDNPRYIDSGMEMARKALALDPSLADAHLALALGYYFKGQATNARLSLLKTMELNPSDSGAMMNLSLLESDLGHYDEALHWARLGFRFEPNLSLAYFHVGIPLLFLGDDAATEKWLTEGERLFPTAVRLQLLLSILDFQRGKERDALQRARRVAAGQPRNEEILNLLADLAMITDASDAEIRVERLFRSAPDLSASSMVLLESSRARYAYLLARRGDTNRAPHLIEEAAALAHEALHQGNEMPRARLEIAALYAVRRQKEPALEWLQQTYNAGYRDPRTLARDPMFEALREEPRFNDLLGRMRSDIVTMRERSSQLH